MVNPAKISNTLIGPGKPCFTVAEAGVNHNGDMTLAHKLIDAAKKAGADAVKFQSFIAEDLVTLEAKKAKYQVETTGAILSMMKKMDNSSVIIYCRKL